MNGRPWRSVHNRGTRPRSQAWYRIENKSDDTAEVLLYDEIGGWWGLTADDFARDMQALKASRITLRINSPGGDVFDGLAIYNTLRLHPANITCRVEGLAASAASFIAMAGDTIQMCRGSMMMIHDAMGFAVGNAADMRGLAELLDKASDNIADLYSARSGGSVEQWRDAMRAETWYSAREAVEARLADELLGEPDPDDDGPTDRWDLSVFAHAGRDNAPAPWMPGRSADPRHPTDRVNTSTTAPVVADLTQIAAALKGAFKR